MKVRISLASKIAVKFHLHFGYRRVQRQHHGTKTNLPSHLQILAGNSVKEREGYLGRRRSKTRLKSTLAAYTCRGDRQRVVVRMGGREEMAAKGSRHEGIYLTMQSALSLRTHCEQSREGRTIGALHREWKTGRGFRCLLYAQLLKRRQKLKYFTSPLSAHVSLGVGKISRFGLTVNGTSHLQNLYRHREE